MHRWTNDAFQRILQGRLCCLCETVCCLRDTLCDWCTVACRYGSNWQRWTLSVHLPLGETLFVWSFSAFSRHTNAPNWVNVFAALIWLARQVSINFIQYQNGKASCRFATRHLSVEQRLLKKVNCKYSGVQRAVRGRGRRGTTSVSDISATQLSITLDKFMAWAEMRH